MSDESKPPSQWPEVVNNAIQAIALLAMLALLAQCASGNIW